MKNSIRLLLEFSKSFDENLYEEVKNLNLEKLETYVTTNKKYDIIFLGEYIVIKDIKNGAVFTLSYADSILFNKIIDEEHMETYQYNIVHDEIVYFNAFSTRDLNKYEYALLYTDCDEVISDITSMDDFVKYVKNILKKNNNLDGCKSLFQLRRYIEDKILFEQVNIDGEDLEHYSNFIYTLITKFNLELESFENLGTEFNYRISLNGNKNCNVDIRLNDEEEYDLFAYFNHNLILTFVNRVLKAKVFDTIISMGYKKVFGRTVFIIKIYNTKEKCYHELPILHNVAAMESFINFIGDYAQEQRNLKK